MRLSPLVWVWLWVWASLQSIHADMDLSLVTLHGDIDPASYNGFYDLSLAYNSLTSDVSIAINPSLSLHTVQAMVQHKIDFGAVVIPLPPLTARTSPSWTLLPLLLTALVPIYRLDALGTESPPVVIGREVMARIFLGEITWWNDSAIADDNRELDMPEQPILVMIQPGVAGLNLILKRALASFYPPFLNLTMTVSTDDDFPTSAYAQGSLIIPPGATNLVTAVVANDGAFTVAWQSVALALGVNVASMVNAAQQVVTANTSSLSYAALERGSAPLPSRLSTADLTDASSAAAWPLALFSYLLIDLNYSRSTCQARQQLVEFFLFCYQSGVAAMLLSARGYTVLPGLIMTQLDVISTLSTQVLCDGNAALPAQVTLLRQIGMSQTSTSLMGLLMSLYEDPDNGGTQDVVWSVYPASDSVLLEKVVASELDVVLLNPDNVDSAAYQALQDSGEYWILPTFGLGVSWFTNPQLSTSINIADQPLVMTTDLFSLILDACLVDWADPRLLPLNPWLATVVGVNLTLPAVPMPTALGCSGTTNAAPLQRYFQTLAQNSTSTDSSVVGCLAAFNAPGNSVAAAYASCTNLPQQDVLFAPNEIIATSLALGIYGCMAMGIVDGDPAKLFPDLAVTGSTGSTDIVGSSWTNIQSCFDDTFDPLTLTFDYRHSQDPQCWPLSQQLVVVVRKQYWSAVTVVNSSSCIPGLDTLQLLYWLYNTPVIDTATAAHNIAQLIDSGDAYDAYSAIINAVLCDDSTLFITLPTIWQLNRGLQSLGYAVGSIGMVMVVCFSVFTIRYHRHPLIRSSSPIFLSISFLGLLLLFASIIALVSPVTATSCSAFQWLLNLGITLTFGPLFAKTWRIYRIFGRRKLSVVKISNGKLMAIVVVLFVVELLLMALWQGISPLQPHLTVASQGNPTVYTNYVQCSTQGAGSSMLAVIGVEKGLLFLFGALMAFSTRKVSSQFNESSQIALSIYNAVFMTAICGVIAYVVSAMGDVLVGLILFVALWVGLLTAGLLIVPKIMAILRPDPTAAEVGSVAGTRGDNRSSSTQFEFISLDLLNTLALVQSYIAALRQHLDLVMAKEVAFKLRAGTKGLRSVASFDNRVAPGRLPPARAESAESAAPMPAPKLLPRASSHHRAQSMAPSDTPTPELQHSSGSGPQDAEVEKEQPLGVVSPVLKSSSATSTSRISILASSASR